MNELRKIASEATPGPWEAVLDDGFSSLPTQLPLSHDDPYCGVYLDEWDARFIATFDPELVGALLDVAEAAQDILDLDSKYENSALSAALDQLAPRR